MKKILMLGSTGRGTTELLLEARKRGLFTIITDNLTPERAPVKLIADEYWMISTDQIDLLEQKCREEGINGVINGISTFNINTTMELCRRLGLPCYADPDSWHFTVDKRAFKDICLKNKVPVAQDYYVGIHPTEEELNKIRFPVVVKAIDLSANRGMSYCNSKEDVLKACTYARSMSKSNTVIIEKMLRGREYTAWYLMAEGEMVLLDFGVMLTQPGYPGNCYSLTTTLSDQRDLFMKEMNDPLINALKDMRCRDGIGWVEMMMDEDDHHLYALEMGYRMSGDMLSLPLSISHGVNIFSWLIDIAMGEKHSAERLKERAPRLHKISEACSYILWSKKGGVLTEISGFEEIRKIPTVNVDSRLRVGDAVGEHQYLAVITFNVNNAEEMIDIINRINSYAVYKVNHEDIVIRYDDFKTLKAIEYLRHQGTNRD